MQVSVSTKMEDAWYVDSELLAAKQEADRAERVEVNAEPRPDETLSLADTDFVELAGKEAKLGETARHYREVSLRGALLLDTRDDASSSGALSRILVSVESIRLPDPDRFVSSASAMARRAAAAATSALEPGKVSPARLAAVSFLAGVAMTLIGVLIAL